MQTATSGEAKENQDQREDTSHEPNLTHLLTPEDLTCRQVGGMLTLYRDGCEGFLLLKASWKLCGSIGTNVRVSLRSG